MSEISTSNSSKNSNNKLSFLYPIRSFFRMLSMDINLEKKYGVIPIYFLALIVYIVVLRVIPINEAFLPIFSSMLLFSDVSVFGLLFIGVLLYYEKTENVHIVVFTTPVNRAFYLLSKGVSLTFIAVYTAVLINWLGGVPGVKYGMIILATALSSGLFIYLGIAAMARFRSFNEFLGVMMAMILVFMIPLFELMDLFTTRLLYILPSKAALILFLEGFEITPQSTGDLIYAVCYLVIATVSAFILANFVYKRQIIQRS